MILNYETAKEKLLASDFDGCLRFFKDKDFKLEEAYCELLNGDLKKALNIFTSISEESSRAQWGAFLCKLISGFFDSCPTYLQLRNFLEIDLDLLIKNYKGNYVENIVKYAQWLSGFNPEIYKFIARVFINNGLQEQGRMFLDCAKSYFYNDPEMHYLVACEFLKDGKIKESLTALNNCLQVLPEYFPAVNMKKKLESD